MKHKTKKYEDSLIESLKNPMDLKMTIEPKDNQAS